MRTLGLRALAFAFTSGTIALACSDAIAPKESKQGQEEVTPPTGLLGGDGGTNTTPGTVLPMNCAAPGVTPGPEVAIAAEFADDYRVFDLGAIPGVPDPLGGCVVQSGDENTLLVAGRSEFQDGALYSIRVKRDACKHIVGFEGTATKMIDAPYIDANLLFAPGGSLIYAMWSAKTWSITMPFHSQIAQKTANATSHSVLADIKTMAGTTDQGPGGLGFVPPGVAAAGELRGLSQPNGDVLHIAWQKSGNGIAITSATKTGTKLSGWPGGFAYVPAGSPGFVKQRIIVAEWTGKVVSTYEVDGSGDPIVATRQLFFEKFPMPWGAYFDAVTGDYFFLTWGAKPDRLFTVQGFAVPPSGPK